MAVPEQTPYVEYIANGNTVNFALGYKCNNSDYLIVEKDGVIAESGTWSLIDNSVVFIEPPSINTRLVFERNTAIERSTNFQSYDNSFRPVTVSTDFDYIIYILQEVASRLLREISDRKLYDNEIKQFTKDYVESILSINNPEAITLVLADIVQTSIDGDIKTQQEFNEYLLTYINTKYPSINEFLDESEESFNSFVTSNQELIDSTVTQAKGDVAEAISTVKPTVDAAVANAGNMIGAENKAALDLIVNKPVNQNAMLDNGDIYRWNGAIWVNTGLNYFNYVNSNPLFKPRYLVSGEDLNVLSSGIYIVPAASWSTILNMPASQMTDPDIGIVICNREPILTGAAYQRVVRYTVNVNNEIESFERLGNGGSGSFAWLPWQKQVSRYEYELNKTAINSAIAAVNASKAEINLFPNYALTSEFASTYQATLSEKNGYPTLTMNTVGVTLVAYDMNVVSNILDVGRVVSFSAEGFCNVANVNAGDLTIQALNSSGAVISTSANAYITLANTQQKITTTMTLPAGTTKIRLRMINRNGTGNTICEFRNATLASDYVFIKYLNPALSSGTVAANLLFVSNAGSDSNKGTKTNPFLTLQKAFDSLPEHGGIVEMTGGFYRKPATMSSKGNVWVRSKRNERAIIFGSDQLVVTKTAGYTQVYQAPLAAKPVGMGGARGKPVIFEFGTLSKPILDTDRQHLHKSATHRFPYTEMFESTTKDELDTVGGRGKWWWESGIIYFAATDGSDATLKPYEARMRPNLIQTDGILHLTRIDTFFSNAEGAQFNGIMTVREDCRSFGNYFNGFSDNSNITKTLHDTAGGNGNDGINGTVLSYNVADVNTRLIAHYVEPHVHNNGDDGLSYHYRGNVRITGGVGEYNTKADFVHVTGATCVCENTISQGTLNGFYVATTATGDTERTASHFRCVNTIARNNTYSYRAADDAILECVNTIAENPLGFAYYQTGVGAVKLKGINLFKGDPSKIKSGNIIVDTYTQVT